MAVIHRTTLKPGKSDLLAGWLPARPWHRGGPEPDLAKAGGFRLDDPRGEVGIELAAVTDRSGPRPLTYHVPLTYRGAPLDGAEHALIGTAEHGVLGRRWIYDGAHDPVAVAQLIGLVLGESAPQAQGESHTPDPSVRGYCPDRTGALASFRGVAETGAVAVTATEGPDATDVLVRTGASGHGGGGVDGGAVAAGAVLLRVNRLLRPAGGGSTAALPEPVEEGLVGHVSAFWDQPDGVRARGLFAVVRGADGDRPAA